MRHPELNRIGFKIHSFDTHIKLKLNYLFYNLYLSYKMEKQLWFHIYSDYRTGETVDVYIKSPEDTNDEYAGL